MERKQLVKYRVPAIIVLIVMAYPLSLPLVAKLARRDVLPEAVLFAYSPLLVAWEQLLPNYQKPRSLKQVELVDTVNSDDGEQ